MKLRVKIPAIMGVVVAVLVLGLYFLITNVFLKESTRLEKIDLQEDIERTRSAIDLDVNNLEVNVGDYAAWDDTYDFAVSKDKKYIDTNFGSASFANLRVNAVVVLNQDRKAIYSKGFDTNQNVETTLSDKFLTDLDKEKDLLEFADDKQSNGEVALLDGHPMMVATRQIIKSDETGPPRGVIIMARNFDDGYINKLSQQTKINISMVNGTDQNTLKQIFKPEFLTSPDKMETIRPINDSKVEAAFTLSCKENDTVAVLKIEKARSIYQMGLTSIREVMGILTLFGTLLVLLVLLLIDLIVVRRLIRMSSKIRKFDLDSAKIPHLIIKGDDELGSSSRVIDRVFKHVVNSKVALNKSLQDVQNEKDKLDAILDSAGDMIIVLDQKGKIVLFNDEAERITGFKVEEALGKKYLELDKLIPKENQKASIKRFEDVLKRGIPSEDHKLIITGADGRQLPIMVSEHPIHYEDKRKPAGCVVVARDITKEYKVDQMKSEFVSIASHQLRTPLTGIKWIISLMFDKKTGKLNATQTEYLKNINESNERMIKLINNMLNISRLESGKSQVERSAVNLKQLLDEVVAAQTVNAKERNIGFVIDKGLSKKIIINADRDKLYEVMMNLVNNAVKYSKENNEVQVGCAIDKKTVVLSVKDNGIGIPEEQQSRVFEKFFRADNALSEISLGTGLGLYYVKSVVEAHGGKIWFESKKNQGSTFYVSLPM